MSEVGVLGFVDESMVSRLKEVGFDLVATEKTAFIPKPIYHDWILDYIFKSDLDDSFKSSLRQNIDLQDDLITNLHDQFNDAEMCEGHIGSDVICSLVDDAAYSASLHFDSFKKTDTFSERNE